MLVDWLFNIVEALFGLFEDAVQAALGLLPEINPPDLSGMVEALGGLFAPGTGYLGWLNRYMPVDQVPAALGVVLGSWAVLYLVRFAVWVLTKAHVLGGD